MNSKLAIKIKEMQIQVISPQIVLDNLAGMKTELEATGCKVSISVDGQEIDAVEATSSTPLEACQECGGSGQKVGGHLDEPCRWCNRTGQAGEWL